MDYKIIVDSCSDITPQLTERLGVEAVIPLTLRLGEKELLDDENLNIEEFMVKMKACKDKVGTAAPSPLAFQNAMEATKNAFVITLSKQVSSTFASAELGKEYAVKNGVDDIHVFDSKSISAGELLVAIKIREFLSKGMSKEQIIKTINSFIANMQTFGVLECYDNLIKNGRLNKIKGKIINILHVKLILGADREGQIALFAKSRGKKHMFEMLMSLIREKEKDQDSYMGDKTMVITHSNNLPLAKQLADAVRSQFDFKEILIVPTRGVVSLYVDDKAVIMAF